VITKKKKRGEGQKKNRKKKMADDKAYKNYIYSAMARAPAVTTTSH